MSPYERSQKQDAQEQLTERNYWYSDDDMISVLKKRISEEKLDENLQIIPPAAFKADPLNALVEYPNGKSKTIVPVNVDGNHWVSLVIFNDGSKREGIFVDTCGSAIPKKLRETLQRLDIQVYQPPMRQQFNSVDCGPLTIENLVNIAKLDRSSGLPLEKLSEGIGAELLRHTGTREAEGFRRKHSNLLHGRAVSQKKENLIESQRLVVTKKAVEGATSKAAAEALAKAYIENRTEKEAGILSAAAGDKARKEILSREAASEAAAKALDQAYRSGNNDEDAKIIAEAAGDKARKEILARETKSEIAAKQILKRRKLKRRKVGKFLIESPQSSMSPAPSFIARPRSQRSK
jgi:hypothetical protein